MAEWADVFSIAGDVIVSASAVIGLIIAIRGLHTWRSELKGKSEYQLAKDALKAVYKVRDTFDFVRNELIFGHEYPAETLDKNGELKSEHKYDAITHAYKNRMKLLYEAFSELSEIHREAQVEWGPEFQGKIKKLLNCRTKLWIATYQYLDLKESGDFYTSAGSDKGEACRLIVKNTGEDNLFTQKINEGVKEFDDWLRPKIDR